MSRLRRHPIFFALVAISLVAIAVEVWYVLVLRREERRLETQLIQKIAEIERLQRQRPGPTDENLRRAREDFAQNAEVLTTMLRELGVSDSDELEYFNDEPPDRMDAFWAIDDLVGDMRTAATQAGVIVRAEERFGFSAYVNEGPDPELIRPVHRQCVVVRHLLDALFPARPRTLVSVQREDPRTFVRSGDPAGAGTPAVRAPAAPRSGSSPGGGSGAGDVSSSDTFTIDPQVSARTPGYVDTMAFRLTFTGHTSSLRGFMNALAVPKIPLVVRSVEVEPLRAEASSASGRAGARLAEGQAESADHAIVADNESRFTVTVELFEVKLRAPAVPEATP